MNGGALTINYDGGGGRFRIMGTFKHMGSLVVERRKATYLATLPRNSITANPNATKIVIPVSDEPPYDGTSWDSQDTNTILEAHDACVNAGVIPTPLWAQSNEDVGSSMKDLAQCPNGIVSSHQHPETARVHQ